MRISSRQYLEATSQMSVNDETSQNELFAKIGARKCFRDADGNKDKVVTQDEVSLSAEAFARLDASKDGKVTQEEISAAMVGHGKEVYSYYVSKRGGANSQDLLTTLLGESSKQDGDSAAEQAARKYLTHKDANKDGVLSRTETPMSASSFTNIDTSGNGTIELTEMQAALKMHETKLSTYFSSISESSSQSTLQKKI